jgi:heme-degrading monooxygenase HmoA
MVAAMSTLRGPIATLAEVSRLAGENVGPWLREYEGYRGTFVLTGQTADTARLITLWETAEDEDRARASRGAMRDQLAATAGMEVVDFEVFEVVAHEVIPEG